LRSATFSAPSSTLGSTADPVKHHIVCIHV
jgi:hypothetical protein